MYKKIFIVILLTFLSTAGIFYFTTENLLFTFIYLLICLGSATFLSLYIFKKYEFKKLKYNECVSFINKFIISLSISNSLFDSFNSCKEILNDKLYLKLKDYDDIESRIKYLTKHYNYKVFDIFSGVLNEYLDKGGDILSYSSTLLSEARRSQTNVNNIYSNSIKGLGNFILMWVFSFLILVIARISLNDFYKNFTSNFGFSLITFIGFIFFIASFIYYFISLNFNKFIEEGKYEKN